jgi:hypothetical protein
MASNGTHDLLVVNTEIVKVRVSKAEKALLRRLAKQKKTTESAVVREGLGLVALQDDRMRAVEELVKMIPTHPSRVQPFGLK